MSSIKLFLGTISSAISHNNYHILCFLLFLIISSSPLRADILSDFNIEDTLLHNRKSSATSNMSFPKSKRSTEVTEKEKALNMKDLKTVQSYKYDANKTYKVKLSTFITTIISLPKGEKIASHRLGDDNLFIAYYDEALPNILTIYPLENGYYTNLQIITKDQKVYNFYLKSIVDDRWNTPDFTVYIEKNEEELKAELLKDLKQNNQNIKTVKKLDDLNTSYKIKGDKDIAPKYVYDDGEFTYIDFGDNFITGRYPIVYKVVDEQDSVVNNHTKGNIIIVESLSPEGFILKNGDKHVCIKPKKKLREVYKDV